MTPERWQQVKAVFQQALERDTNERSTFVAQACGSDEALRREVTLLLDGHAQAESFIETPAHEIAADFVGVQTSLVGRKLSHYEILAPLGKGGMGEVYQARDTKLDRTVALKILPADVASDAERLRRFVREAKAASALNHPHVATIHEIGEAEGIHFIAMEYVEGQSLAAKINGQPLAIHELLEIGSQIADALDEAHSKGITHRDIKPANVMLTARGQVKVLDFGLAKIARPPVVDSNVSTLAKTASGVVMGTIPYMSPEQALGREIDHRSDIFSLGVVFYEMATGKLPFAGANTVETLDRILHAQPDAMAQCNDEVPAELERIVRKCLEKERERRYQSARELLVELNYLKRESEQVGRSVQEIGPPPRKAIRFRHSAVMTLAVLVLSLAGLAYFVQKTPLPPKVTAYTQITKDGLTKLYYPWLYTNLFTDGSRLYFSERVGEQWGITQVAVTGGETAKVSTPFSYVFAWDIFPSRSELLVQMTNGFAYEGPLWVLPVLGGTPRRVGNVESHTAAWSFDGEKIVYAKGKTLYLASKDGTESRELVTVSGKPYWLRWSPDGSRLRFTVQDPNVIGVSTLWEVFDDGSNLQPLLPDWNQPAAECCGNWTADGRYFVFQSSRNGIINIWAKPERTGLFQRNSQEPVQLTNGPQNYHAPLPSQDGKKIFVIGEQKRGELARYDPKTLQWNSYLSGISAEDLDFSRDGTRVVYQTYPEGSLWRSKIDGSEPLQLTYPPMEAAGGRWSPDNKQIAFVARAPGNPWKTYLVSAEGGIPQQLMSGENSELDPNWSPDGNSLVFWSGNFATKSSAIYLLDLRTRQVSTLPGSEGLFSPRWSRDGRYMLAIPFVSLNKLLLYDFTTQQWTELVQRAMDWPRWSRDGKYIYFASYQGNDPALFRVQIVDRKIERLASLKNFRLAVGFGGAWVGWTPDDLPLALRDIGAQDIYALDWQAP